MSFFKDFKDDLSQAVNELVSDEDTKLEESQEESDNNFVEAMSEDTEDDMDMQILNELLSDSGEQSEVEDVNEEVAEPEEAIEEVVEEVVENQKVEENQEVEENQVVEKEPSYAEVVEEFKKESMEEAMNEELEQNMNIDEEAENEAKKEALRGNRASGATVQNELASTSKEAALDEVTEITKGTAIEGNVISEGSMNIYGKIKGNVACRGKLVVSGTIVGASRAAEVYTNNAKIDGDVTSDGSIKVGNGSIIIGNIYGTTAVIAGAVKGDIDVHGPVIIDGTAVVQGNIRSRSVQINNGAAIEGSVSQCYAEIDYIALFDKTFAK